LVALTCAVQPRLWSGTNGIGDFWPFYYGARAWLETGNAYWHDPGLPSLVIADVGNAYPIHGILFGLPFAWLSPGIAAILWVAVCGLGWIWAVIWSGESLVWFLWAPMWIALLAQQPSALVTVACIVALGGLRRSLPPALIVAIPVMLLKPHQTLLLVLLFVWWGRRWWRGMTLCWSAGLLLTFVVQPDWAGLWVDQVQLRNLLITDAVWIGGLLVPAGLVLLIRGWRLSGLAMISTSLGPWPALGGYVASIWPIGLTDRRIWSVALANQAAFVLYLATLHYWLYPLALVASCLAAALFVPGPEASNTNPLSSEPTWVHPRSVSNT
jgi:hypothetical protein